MPKVKIQNKAGLVWLLFALLRFSVSGLDLLAYLWPSLSALQLFGDARPSTDSPEFDKAEKDVRDRIARLMAIKGTKSPDQIHKKLGHIMWNLVGMGRTLQGLVEAIKEIEEVRKEFYSDLRIVGQADDLNGRT